jgi:AP endonuclease-1
MVTTAAQAASPGSDLSDLPEDSIPKVTPKKSPKKGKAAPVAVKAEVDGVAAVEDGAVETTGPKKGKGKAATKRPNTTAKTEVDEEADEKPKKKPRVSKASIFPPTDLDPSIHPPRKGYSPVFTFPDPPAGVPRNGGIVPTSDQMTSRPIFLGAHTSIAAGPATALLKAGMLGANGLAMFVKSQRQWKSKDYEEESVERFRALMKPKDEGGECEHDSVSRQAEDNRSRLSG